MFNKVISILVFAFNSSFYFIKVKNRNKKAPLKVFCINFGKCRFDNKFGTS